MSEFRHLLPFPLPLKNHTGKNQRLLRNINQRAVYFTPFPAKLPMLYFYGMMPSQLPIFYAPLMQASDTHHQLDDAGARHAMQVLRMQAGDQMLLTNGLGLMATAGISSATKKTCTVTIQHMNSMDRQVPRRSGIAISPVKNASRFEWFLEKATELGISDIYPLLCHRTVKTQFRQDRMMAICVSAMLQSQQAWLPVLHPPVNFSDALGQMGKAYSHRFLAHCIDQDKTDFARLLSGGMDNALLLIGPEGDFTPEEISGAIAQNYRAVSLGATRLRTETAGLAGAVLLCQVMENKNGHPLK